MRIRTCLLAGVVVAAAVARGDVVVGQRPGFDTYFLNKTMRVDYVHSGGLGQEIFALDQIVSDGPWAGSRTRLLDDLNLGKYRFEVLDRRTNQVLYSRGFASIYGEWETVPESREVHRSFHESLRFPVAAGPGAGRAQAPRRRQQLPGTLVHGHRPRVPVS